MTKETEIKGQIKDYLKLKNIAFWHNLLGIGAYCGIPDICAVINGKFIGIEVKTSTGRLSEHQENFKNMIYNAGGIYIVARCLEDVMRVIK